MAGGEFKRRIEMGHLAIKALNRPRQLSGLPVRIRAGLAPTSSVIEANLSYPSLPPPRHKPFGGWERAMQWDRQFNDDSAATHIPTQPLCAIKHLKLYHRNLTPTAP